MQIINLTPHDINVVKGDDDIVTFPRTGTVARVAQSSSQINMPGANVPFTRSAFGDVTDLPAPAQDTYYIVSRMVADAAKDRTDLVVPNGLVRDDAGNIIGCQSLDLVNA